MSRITAGPRCKKCAETEQRCAYVQGCCASCTHWGPQAVDVPDQRVAQVVDIRPPAVRHGTDKGYWRHRRDHTAPCWSCRLAHLRAKGLVA